MKTKYPRIFGLLAAVLLVASFVVPVSLMNPAPVEAGVCKWDTTMTPGYLPLKNDIGLYAPHDMVVGGDGATVLIAARYALPDLLPTVPAGGVVYSALFWTNNGGISFSGTKYTSFADAFWTLNNIATPAPLTRWPNVYLVAIAPDNPNFWAIVTDTNQGDVALTYTPQEVWVTTNAGGKWECTNFYSYLSGLTLTTEMIRTIDISVDYGGKRDIAVGTATGTAAGGDVYVVPSTGFAGWKFQNFALGDFYAVKFSPTYPSDASLAVVYADNTDYTASGGAADGATWYNISQRDIDANSHLNWAFTPAVEVKDSTWGLANSPGIATLNRADLELPSDFSGQAASLRRAYVSLDAYNTGAAKGTNRDGIFRMDDTTVYTLMDTNIPEKSIYSIAYFGTYASGKLLAGERRGSPCTATVPTWFTDSPTTCPIPCWYPALKPTTGAAGVYKSCTGYGNGGALVGWRADGNIAFALTGSYPALPTPTSGGWYKDWVLVTGFYGLVLYDESALAISRNNGETWNQIALINTKINSFTDVAPTPDCKTVYLASVNNGAGAEAYYCGGFDSVWRTSSNTEVVSPYPALPVGIFWERVLTRVTSASCNMTQTNAALLRIVPYCADPSGQIVAWGVYDTNKIDPTKGVAAWSPDYGDYWANITVRDPIQDFTFESATVLYFLSPDGPVQKMPYTGTAWSTTLSSIDPVIYGAHTIAAYPEGKVLVGAATAYHSTLYAVSYAGNFNTDNPSFTVQSMAGRTTFYGDVHVAFHPAFKDNNTYFIDDTGAAGGSVYRNSAAAQQRWADTDMMDAANGAIGCPAPIQEPQYGLVLAFTGEALYSAGFDASDNTTGVWRTIDDGTGRYGPLSGMPKPGIAWDRLTVGLEKAPAYVKFTLQPSSLKACGCCTLETDTTLYAIDNAAYNATTHVLWTLPFTTIAAVTQSGLLWGFTDCVAKKGPALITADKTLIGCDPVSGRAQEVNLCWEQLCVASLYDIEIAKSAEFTIKVLDWVAESTCGGLRPADITAPCAYIPAGGSFAEDAESDEEAMGSAVAFYGQLECGHTYYWRVKVRECATGQDIRSPWSEVRSFTVKAGLPVSTPYYGVQLLAPNNGGLGIPVKPVSFSWSPFKETTKYKFVLAKDAAMTQVVKEADVTTTAFEYDGALDYSTNYFWRVMSVEPAPSDWSATFSFLTEAAPAAAPGPTPAPPTPVWVWVVIALGAILVIVTLVLIFKTRRV